MDATIKVAELRGSRGAAWIGESFALFRRAPLAWIGLCAGWLVMTVGLLVIPLIGGVIGNFLQPVFFASFAIAAYRQSSGEAIAMGDLFAGFRRNARALVNLGALLLLAEISIFTLMWALGLPLATSEDRTFTVADYVEILKGKEWILAVGLLAMLLVKGAVWFAPPLIAFHGMGTAQAIRWSVYAAISNLGAMIVYGAVLMLLFMVGLVTWGLAFIVIVPLVVISTYVGYREVFEAS